MSEYLTIKQACDLTGKSDKTIRRNIINVKEKYNLPSHVQVVTRQNNRYLILKSFLIEHYSLDTPGQKNKNDQVVPSHDQVEPGQNEDLLSFVKAQLNEKKEDIKYLKEQMANKDVAITEHLRQADQSQRLIAQLQQTNSALLLEVEPPVEVKSKADEIKKEGSWWWMIISLLSIILLVILAYYIIKTI